ncbi:hypothetical protein ACHQM5_012504 [Ranunculus cassubicifolius]
MMSFYRRSKPAFGSFLHQISPQKHPNYICSPGTNTVPSKSFSLFLSASKPNPSSYQRFSTKWKNYYKHVENRYQFLVFPLRKVLNFLIGSSLLVSLYYVNLESVPESKRVRLVLLPSAMDKKIGEFLAENVIKNVYKVLPDTSSEYVRANLILENVVKGLEIQLKNPTKVQTSFKLKPMIQHLEGLKWEILVVDKASAHAYSLPGGKIVINTGLLKLVKTDAEIATFVAREVASVFTRNYAEYLTKEIGICIVKLIGFIPYVIFSYIIHMPEVVDRIFVHHRGLYWHQVTNAFETDGFSLLLMARAGYDPRVVSQVYYRYGHLLKDPLFDRLPAKTRAELLARVARTVPLAIYMEKQAIGSSSKGKSIEPSAETPKNI